MTLVILGFAMLLNHTLPFCSLISELKHIQVVVS